MTEQELGKWILALENGPQLQRAIVDTSEYVFKVTKNTPMCCLGRLSFIQHNAEVVDLYDIHVPPLCEDINEHHKRKSLCIALNDSPPKPDHYAMVLADLKGAPEYWITER